jgi:uncharacterized protein
MAFLITAIDHTGMEAKREEVREAHRTYLARQGRKLLASGALLAFDGKTIIGGASLLDTNDPAEAARFEADDPYAKAGIRATVQIVRWRLRWWIGDFNVQEHQPSLT